MARGWGKDEDHRDGPATPEKRDTRPDELRRAEAARQRLVQGLEQQRERILSERTSNPHRRAALQAALQQIEESLAKAVAPTAAIQAP